MRKASGVPLSQIMTLKDVLSSSQIERGFFLSFARASWTSYDRYVRDGRTRLARVPFTLGVFKSLGDGLGIAHFLETASEIGPDKK